MSEERVGRKSHRTSISGLDVKSEEREKNIKEKEKKKLKNREKTEINFLRKIKERRLSEEREKS